MAKLTKPQVKLLTFIERCVSLSMSRYRPVRTGYGFFIVEPVVLRSLIAKGYIADIEPDGYSRDTFYHITDAGRAALSRASATPESLADEGSADFGGPGGAD